ncbi:MAG TPA: hypothetical protein IAB47_00370 [Candidatus Scatomorpha merdigallinarum]|nr:hypothetical protein [Candidatus Scatomorpha merdigallinarum]
MDISKLAGSLDEKQRARLDALANSNEAKALEGMFSDAELARAATEGDEKAMRDVLRRILSTGEGRKLAQMLSDAMK